jgi:hypothetical protein
MQLVCFYPNDEVVPLGKDSEAAVITSKFLVIVDPLFSFFFLASSTMQIMMHWWLVYDEKLRRMKGVFCRFSSWLR